MIVRFKNNKEKNTVQTTPNKHCILFGVVCSGKKHTKNQKNYYGLGLILTCDDSAILMMFVMIVVYLHIFMEKCDSDTKYHNSTFMIDNVCKIVLL